MTELQTKLVQEEERLKKQGVHFVNLVGSSGFKNKSNKKYGKGKRPLKINESCVQVHKKDKTKEKCHFCKKVGHYMRDCLKRKAWFEKKGKPSAFVCFESYLSKVPYNTWWIDFGCTIHISNTM